jgi:putative ABC transport system ATP-binding protein
MNKIIFQLKNVQFQNLLSYPDIEIPENCTTFICGKSGSGKSTLLKLLNGVISASSGTITYLGKNVADYEPTTLRRQVLLVGQSSHLFDQTIAENFHQYYSYLDLNPIDMMDMQHYLNICAADLPLDSVCTTLSGGEKQRVFIAINISYSPKVLMLDEPTSALDDLNARTLINNIKSDCLRTGKTLLIVSHDQEIAKQYADNLIFLA